MQCKSILLCLTERNSHATTRPSSTPLRRSNDCSGTRRYAPRNGTTRPGAHQGRKRSRRDARLAVDLYAHRPKVEMHQVWRRTGRPLDNDRGVRFAGERSCRRQARFFRQHRSTVAVCHQPVPSRLLPGQGRAARPTPRSVHRQNAAHPSDRRAAATAMFLGALRNAGDSQGLGQRRVPRQAVGHQTSVSELHHLHCPR